MAAFMDSGHFWWKQCANCRMAWFVGDKPADAGADEECQRCEEAEARVLEMAAGLRAETERLKSELARLGVES